MKRILVYFEKPIFESQIDKILEEKKLNELFLIHSCGSDATGFFAKLHVDEIISPEKIPQLLESPNKVVSASLMDEKEDDKKEEPKDDDDKKDDKPEKDSDEDEDKGEEDKKESTRTTVTLEDSFRIPGTDIILEKGERIMIGEDLGLAQDLSPDAISSEAEVSLDSAWVLHLRKELRTSGVSSTNASSIVYFMIFVYAALIRFETQVGHITTNTLEILKKRMFSRVFGW